MQFAQMYVKYHKHSRKWHKRNESFNLKLLKEYLY
jgi:hypothetical protein